MSELLKSTELMIELHENYPKQTYRNRCYIYSANGVLPLVIPVEKGSFHKIKLKEIRIDNSRKWRREHINAIVSAYNSSAFFEFYRDELLLPLEKEYEYLIDLNMNILNIILNILESDIVPGGTESFIADYGREHRDLRYEIEPKKKARSGYAEYFQVFSPKFGFKPNLSILDLIFNMGPEAWSCLRT